MRLLWREFLHLLRLLVLERCLSPGTGEPKQTHSPAQGHENRSVTPSHCGFIDEADGLRIGLRAEMEGWVRLHWEAPRTSHPSWDRENLGNKEPCRQGEVGEAHGRSLGL